MTATIAFSPDVAARAQSLQSYIAEGRIIEAMHEFYDDDVVMQENGGEPTRGLAANIDREQRFLDGVKEWKRYEVRSIGVGNDTSAVESVMEFVAANGAPVRLEQVSVQRWKDGRIVSERFYYDSAK